MDVLYPPGSIVWVKLEGGRWWPGEVTDDPDSNEATKGLRKPPLAVVKFFDEDCFHVVKSEQHIYPYDCEKKEEFLTRGKDFKKVSGKDNFSLQLKFEADVSKAESLCKPVKKTPPTNNTVITALRGAKYASYMKIPPAERFDYGANAEEKEIWEPTFVSSRNELGAARIRNQPSTPKAKETMYSCDTCTFQTTRIENFIRHHKSHSDPYRFHPGVESSYEKLSVKSRKRVKDGAKGKKRTKKTDEEKNKSETPKKRKAEEKERRVAPKKRKIEKDKTPFSNPFEEEEEEKKKENVVVTNDDDLDEIDDKKPPEAAPSVKWEEFIKGTPVKSPVTTTENEEKKEVALADDEEENILITNDPSTYPISENDFSENMDTEEVSNVEADEENSAGTVDISAENNDEEISAENNDEEISAENNDEEISAENNDEEISAENNDEEISAENNDEEISAENNDEEISAENNEEEISAENNDEDISDDKVSAVQIEDVAALNPRNGLEMDETTANKNIPEKEITEKQEDIFTETIMEEMEEMPADEIGIQEEVTSEVVVSGAEMSGEEIVVTEQLNAGEMMVGEEIEVQEIEIQSDGMTGNEIVLGDEVVMHLLPEERPDGNVLIDPMMPQTNDQHISTVLADGDYTPVYVSDHSLMAAAPVNKVNSTSDFVEKECRENEETVRVSQDLDAEMNS